MKWFTFTQNNSGGWFDERVGHYVIIQAVDADAANTIALKHGIYFNGCEDGKDCSCCGDRWNTAYGKGDEVPSIYGKPVTVEYEDNWMERPILIVPAEGEPYHTGRRKQSRQPELV